MNGEAACPTPKGTGRRPEGTSRPLHFATRVGGWVPKRTARAMPAPFLSDTPNPLAA